MGKVFFRSGDAGQQTGSSPIDHDDDGWDADVGAEAETLIEENARLRALVVQLSRLVLKNVVEPK